MHTITQANVECFLQDTSFVCCHDDCPRWKNHTHLTEVCCGCSTFCWLLIISSLWLLGQLAMLKTQFTNLDHWYSGEILNLDVPVVCQWKAILLYFISVSKFYFATLRSMSICNIIQIICQTLKLVMNVCAYTVHMQGRMFIMTSSNSL
jgi:hypothetical protein